MQSIILSESDQYDYRVCPYDLQLKKKMFNVNICTAVNLTHVYMAMVCCVGGIFFI